MAKYNLTLIHIIGFVSASYALKHRERLDNLVLLSPIGLQGFQFPADQVFSLSARILFTSIWTLTPQRILGMLPKSRVLRMLANSRARTVQAFGYPDDTVIRYVYELATQSVSGEMAFSKLMGPSKDSTMVSVLVIYHTGKWSQTLQLFQIKGMACSSERPTASVERFATIPDLWRTRLDRL